MLVLLQCGNFPGYHLNRFQSFSSPSPSKFTLFSLLCCHLVSALLWVNFVTVPSLRGVVHWSGEEQGSGSNSDMTATAHTIRRKILNSSGFSSSTCKGGKIKIPPNLFLTICLILLFFYWSITMKTWNYKFIVIKWWNNTNTFRVMCQQSVNVYHWLRFRFPIRQINLADSVMCTKVERSKRGGRCLHIHHFTNIFKIKKDN